MSHPPFAPNCIINGIATPNGATSNVGEGWAIEVQPGLIQIAEFNNSNDFTTPLPWKKIGADIERCAWLDEARRIDDEITITASSIQPLQKRSGEAHQNAEAWRAWATEK